MRHKKIILCALGIMLFFCPAVQAENSVIEFRLVGGISNPSVLDPNTYLRGYSRYLHDYARVQGLAFAGELETLGLGIDFQGEIILRLSGRIGLGLGVGYSRVQKKGQMVTMSSSFNTVQVTMNNQGSIIPLLINGYYFLPFSSRVRLSLAAGIGYYLADWTYTRGLVQVVGGARGADTDHYEVRSRKLGYQAGIGLEWDIFRRLSLVLEGFGRYARLEDFSGDWSYT